jgi:hypothetical protein
MPLRPAKPPWHGIEAGTAKTAAYAPTENTSESGAHLEGSDLDESSWAQDVDIQAILLLHTFKVINRCCRITLQ